MSIDLNKPNEGSGTSNSSQSSNSNAGPNYSDPNSSADVREIFRFAYECKQKNMPDYQIEQSLMNRGLDPSQVASVMRIVNQAYNQAQPSQQTNDSSGSGGGGIPSAVYFIGILVLINVLSAIFDWGFWIY
jgi:hypothetical protein